MAKIKTAHIRSDLIKPKSVQGYGLTSPYTLNSSETNNRRKSDTGSGDYYGSGIRNPIGRVRSGANSNPVSKEGLTKPPKKLA